MIPGNFSWKSGQGSQTIDDIFVDANHDGETAESDFCVLVLLNPLGVNRNLYFLNVVCLFSVCFRLFFVSSFILSLKVVLVLVFVGCWPML